MKIGLLDVDSHNFPNLCLMKISAYHKARGDEVEMLNGFMHYDKVYVSKVFDETYSPDYLYPIYADEVVKGGTGYGLKDNLPDEIEHIYPDYSLYGIEDQAYGFITRGCPRKCGFCIVSEKEGARSVQVADVNEFWSGQNEIRLLDPNLLACKDSNKILQRLGETNAWIDFTQGLDARLLTDEKIDLIKRIRIHMMHFAWDNPSDDYVPRQLEKLSKAGNFDKRKTIIYMLTNYNTTHEEDLHRVYKIKEIGFYPYVTIYDKPHAPRITRRLARWVNNKWFFNACEKFEEFTG